MSPWGLQRVPWVLLPLPQQRHPCAAVWPRAPTAMAGRVMASSPERTMKPDGTVRQTSLIWLMFPDASLTAATFGIEARRTSVGGMTLHPVRPGTL